MWQPGFCRFIGVSGSGTFGKSKGLDQIRSAINLRNKENQTSTIKPSHGTEASFGQNLGQSLESDAVVVAVSD
jgi:hypothetical protein